MIDMPPDGSLFVGNAGLLSALASVGRGDQ